MDGGLSNGADMSGTLLFLSGFGFFGRNLAFYAMQVLRMIFFHATKLGLGLLVVLMFCLPIDTWAQTQLQQITTVPVQNNPFGIAVTPNGQFVYVTNRYSNSVSVINTATNAVVATVPAIGNVQFIAMAPSGSFAYAVNGAPYNSVSVINTATNTVVATVPVGGQAAGDAVTPNSSFVYVANWASNNVSVISTATNTVVATVPVGSGPYSVAVNPNGGFVYVTNQNDSTVSVISIATNTVVATVPVGANPLNVVVAPNGNFVYVANRSANTVSVISTATNTVVATVPVSSTSPFALAITPNGNFVYTGGSDGTLSAISTATNTVVATMPVIGGSNAMVFNPNGYVAYLSNYPVNTVQVLGIAPTVALKKTSVGGAGTFSYTLTGLNNTSDTVTTTASGTTVASTQINVGVFGTAVTVTESAASAAGYATSISCADANASTDGVGGASPMTVNGTAVTLGAAQMVAGAAWTCSYTNTKSPDPAHSGVAVTANNALANGIATDTLSAYIADSGGNPLANQVVTFTQPTGATLSNTTCTTAADGTCQVTVASTVAATYSSTVTIGGTALNGNITVGGVAYGPSPVSYTFQVASTVMPTCTASPNPAMSSQTVTITCTGGQPGDTDAIPGTNCSPATVPANGPVVCTGIAGNIGNNPVLTVTSPSRRVGTQTVALTVLAATPAATPVPALGLPMLVLLAMFVGLQCWVFRRRM